MPDLSLSGTQIDVGTTGERFGLKVAALKDGTFVAVWAQYDADGNIFAQIYNADGSPKNDPFQVNTTSPGTQRNPSVTALNDGGFAIAWEDYSTGSVIRARVYNAARDAATEEDFIAIESNIGSHISPQIISYGQNIVVAAQNPDTGLLEMGIRTKTGATNGFAGRPAIFESHSMAKITDAPDDARYRDMFIHARLDASAGLITIQAHSTPTAAESRAISTGNGTPSSVSVTALAGGRFVVTWKEHDPLATSSYKIKAVIYEADGTQTETKTLTLSRTEINKPVVVALPNGGFALAYENGKDIKAQTYDASGTQVHTDVFDKPFLTSVGAFSFWSVGLKQALSAWCPAETGVECANA